MRPFARGLLLGAVLTACLAAVVYLIAWAMKDMP